MMLSSPQNFLHLVLALVALLEVTTSSDPIRKATVILVAKQDPSATQPVRSAKIVMQHGYGESWAQWLKRIEDEAQLPPQLEVTTVLDAEGVTITAFEDLIEGEPVLMQVVNSGVRTGSGSPAKASFVQPLNTIRTPLHVPANPISWLKTKPQYDKVAALPREHHPSPPGALSSIRPTMLRHDESVVAVYEGHDANVCVTVGGRLVVHLELERVFKQRYFAGSKDDTTLQEQWTQVMAHVNNLTGISTYDRGVHVREARGMRNRFDVLRTVVSVRKWDEPLGHHAAHAVYGWRDSQMENALVFSYDGGGNDGTWKAYHGSVNGLREIASLPINLGAVYSTLAHLFPEVTGHGLCKDTFDDGSIHRYTYCGQTLQELSLPGKLMGYEALGRWREEWVEAVRDMFERPVPGWIERIRLGFDGGVFTRTNHRDLAATVQHVFEEVLMESIRPVVQHPAYANIEGIVLVGGCALNIKGNSRVQKEFGRHVHIPAAPNDAGLAIGGAWHVNPPPACGATGCNQQGVGGVHSGHIAFLGFPLWDEQLVPELVQKHGAKLTTVEEVASLLAAGAIVGVIRGRQEVGPRALGHRSFLASPHGDGIQMRQRLNRLKRRAWYRPVCPMVAIEAAPYVFTDIVASPYMSFAPTLTDSAQQAMPAIVHYDGTARPQTVTADQEPWVHALLHAYAKSIKGGPGDAVLINTSFNTHGQPLLNEAAEALRLLKVERDLDYVVIENWIFSKDSMQ